MPPIPPTRLCSAARSIMPAPISHSHSLRIIMNIHDDPNSRSLETWALQKFGIGQPVPRTEDPTLVQGHGTYTDDVNLDGQAYAAIVRSRHAHGLINGIDTAAALAMPV